MTDPFTLALALGPLAVYFILIGLIQSARHPLVTTGWQDTLALAIGISGLLLAGPLNLFFPNAAYGMLGWIVWVMLATFFLLSLLMIILTMRPRIIVYGATAEQIRGPLLRAAQSLDPGARMQGDQVWFPTINTAVRIDLMSPPDTPQIVPVSTAISPLFWTRLARAFRSQVRSLENRTAARGIGLVAIGLLILGLVGFQMFMQPREVLAGFREWLRL